jgi:hypothetical protein
METRTKSHLIERTLHRWGDWNTSVAHGREAIKGHNKEWSADKYRNIAIKFLSELSFPRSSMLELYWLTCVFSDYQNNGIFYFEKLVLPKWFPLPFGVKFETRFSFKSKRIYPPQMWDESDKSFFFEREPHVQYMSDSIKNEYFQKYPEIDDDVLILPDDHPLRKMVKKGRPNKRMNDGGYADE